MATNSLSFSRGLRFILRLSHLPNAGQVEGATDDIERPCYASPQDCAVGRDKTHRKHSVPGAGARNASSAFQTGTDIVQFRFRAWTDVQEICESELALQCRGACEQFADIAAQIQDVGVDEAAAPPNAPTVAQPDFSYGFAHFRAAQGNAFKPRKGCANGKAHLQGPLNHGAAEYPGFLRPA